eukprot:g70087.t1
MVCSFVADNPLWLFATWARVCKRVNRPSARPAAPHFSLDLCKIRGPVPTSIWQEWKELTRLSFQDMQATRPPVFAALAANRTRVQAIALDDIGDLDLAGAAGIHGLRSIERRSRRMFKHGCVTDVGLVHLAGLRSLLHLDLSYSSQITDAGLVHLSGLLNLQQLSLRYLNRITSLVHLSRLGCLHYLDIGSCSQLTDDGLVYLSALRNLHHLDLNYCSGLSNAGLVHFSGLRALHNLDLSCCDQITDAGLSHLAGFTNLQYLELSNCHCLTAEGRVHLSGLHKLRKLVFPSN